MQQARQEAVHAWYLATHDDTTGLPNRRALLAHLHTLLRTGQRVGLVLLDLDDFKTVNDRHGHEAGNDLLTEVGHRLVALGGPVVLAARLSGDEYALLVTGNLDQVAAAAHTAWQAVTASPVDIGAGPIPVGVSVGYTCATPGVTVRSLLNAADQAMYHAKTTGSGVCGHPVAHASGPPPRIRHRDIRHHTT